MGCLRIEPLAYLFLFEKLQIGAQFGIQVLFDTIFADQIAPEIGEATHAGLTCVQSARDRQRDAAPLHGLDIQLAAACFGQLVVFCPPIVFRFPPGGGEPTCFLHTVEGWKQRSRFDQEGPGSDLLDAPGDSQAMHWIKGQRFENEQVERALQQVDGRRWNGFYRHSI